MKKSYAILLAFLFCLTNSALSHHSLKIINPDWWWGQEGEPGTIEEAVFTVEPKGLYTEVGMYLTISAEGSGFGSWDSLEIVLDFDLPKGSILHDSWLWVNDVIIKADIMDVWSATAIYEEIVDRRRDPSLLFRKPGGGYQLRVYPLPGNESRKVKISYLSPAIWTNGHVKTHLPVDILQASAQIPDNFQIINLPGSAWTSPVLEGMVNTSFLPGTDPVWGSYLYANVPGNLAGTPLTFSVEAPLDNNLYFSLWDDGNEKFYQLAYLPENLPVSSNQKKVVFLFDHDASTTYLPGQTLYDFMVKMIKENLTGQDSFNMGFSTVSGSYLLSNHWIPADSTSVVTYLGSLSNPVNYNYNIVKLLKDGINFIKNNMTGGSIMLLSSSKKLNAWTTDSEVQEILDLIGPDDIPVDIINYQTSGYYFEWNDLDQLLYNNQEFYQNITLATSGNLYSTLDGGGSAWESIRTAFSDMDNSPAVYDLHPSPVNGFTYQRYYQDYLGQSVQPNKPILQTGKFAGEFPVHLSFSTLTDTGFFTENKVIEANQVVVADSLSRETWIGHHIHYLEGGNPGSNIIHDIIDISIAERVLSNYTAFIALEPSQGGEPCWNCWNDPDINVVNVQDQEKETFTLSAWPNPSPGRFFIQLKTNGIALQPAIKAEVFDAYGRIIKTLEAGNVPYLEEITLAWDGSDAQGHPVPDGIYHVVIRLEEEVLTLKLVLAR